MPSGRRAHVPSALRERRIERALGIAVALDAHRVFADRLQWIRRAVGIRGALDAGPSMAHGDCGWAIRVGCAFHTSIVRADRRAATAVAVRQTLDALSGAHVAIGFPSILAIGVAGAVEDALVVVVAHLTQGTVGIDQALHAIAVPLVADRRSDRTVGVRRALGALRSNWVAYRRVPATIRVRPATDTRVGDRIAMRRVSGAARVAGARRHAVVAIGKTHLPGSTVGAGPAGLAMTEHTNRFRSRATGVVRAFDAPECRAAGGGARL